MEFKLPKKLLFLGGIFLASVGAFSLVLGSYLSTLTLSVETVLRAIPILIILFLSVSLMIVFSLLADKKVLIFCLLAAAILFVLPFGSLSLLWRLVLMVVLLLGFAAFGFQAKDIHEAYTGFSASYYVGLMRNFFLLFGFILGLVFFVRTAQILGEQHLEIPNETLRPIVSQLVETTGGMLKQQVGGMIPEEELAPLVEEQLVQLLQQLNMEIELTGQPYSFAQVTGRITEAINISLNKAIDPFKVYIPFLIAVTMVMILFPLTPVVGLIGAFIFFIVYRVLVLVRVLRFEEAERTVKRLVLA